MGKKSILISFWLAGFVIGVLAWDVRSPFVQFMENFGLTAAMSQAMIAGFFGSMVMVLAVVFWAFLSSSPS